MTKCIYGLDHDTEQGTCALHQIEWVTYSAPCPSCGVIAEWHATLSTKEKRTSAYVIDCKNCGELKAA